MKSVQFAVVACALLVAGMVPAVLPAQTSGIQQNANSAPLTRSEVKMERDEFLKSHRWDGNSETWVFKEGVEPSAGVKTRAEVKAERQAFLRTHRWNPSSETWDPIKPEQAQSKSREQVREETRQFVKTHDWDGINDTWVEKAPRRSKAK